MKTRVITSVVGVLLLVGIFFLYHTLLFNLLFCAVCLLAIHEVFDAFGFEKRDWPLFISFVPLVLAVMLFPAVGLQMWVMAVLYAFLLFVLVYFVRGSKRLSFEKMGGMVSYSLLVLFCFYSLVSIKNILPQAMYQNDAVYCTVMVMGYAWGGDTFAYLVGRKFGKRKLAPNVSPNKTVEGAIGGVLGSVLVGLLISMLYTQLWSVGPLWQGNQAMQYGFVALLGGIASVLGMLGDLFASAVKRQCGLKDYGTIFPGHGGIMDRFDSLILVAPLMAVAVQLYR